MTLVVQVVVLIVVVAGIIGYIYYQGRSKGKLKEENRRLRDDAEASNASEVARDRADNWIVAARKRWLRNRMSILPVPPSGSGNTAEA